MSSSVLVVIILMMDEMATWKLQALFFSGMGKFVNRYLFDGCGETYNKTYHCVIVIPMLTTSNRIESLKRNYYTVTHVLYTAFTYRAKMKQNFLTLKRLCDMYGLLLIWYHYFGIIQYRRKKVGDTVCERVSLLWGFVIGCVPCCKLDLQWFGLDVGQMSSHPISSNLNSYKIYNPLGLVSI